MKLLLFILFLGSLTVSAQGSFDLKKDFVKHDWFTCYDDSLYTASDTIYLYNNRYTYLALDWCSELMWSIERKRISLHRTLLCQEPPLSTVNAKLSNFRLSISEKNDFYTIKIGHGSAKHARFNVIQVEDVHLANRGSSVRIALVRVYENDVSF